MPNYTGSIGFGEFYVQALIGQCGTLDVEDVKASVDYLVKEGKGEHGPGKQFVTGGSHGGFLTAHRKSTPPCVTAPHPQCFCTGIRYSRRAASGHIHCGSNAQPGHNEPAFEYGHPRLVFLRVRRAPIGGERADAARALCAALPVFADRARAKRACPRPAPPRHRGPPRRQRAGQGILSRATCAWEGGGAAYV